MDINGQLYEDIETMHSFFTGKLPKSDPRIMAALRRLPDELEKYKRQITDALKKVDVMVKKKAEVAVSSALSDISLDALERWFKDRGIVVSYTYKESTEFKKLFLFVLYNIFKDIEPERYKGLKVKFFADNFVEDNLELYSNKYSEKTDAITLSFKSLFNDNIGLSYWQASIRQINDLVIHELTHRYDLLQLVEDERRDYINISWDYERYLENERRMKSTPNLILLCQPRQPDSLHMHFPAGIRSRESIIHFKPDEDLAGMTGHLASNNDAVVTQAVNNMLRYNDPRLAQKVLFAYSFFGRVVSDDCWVVRIDGRRFNSLEGTYMFKTQAGIYKLTLINTDDGLVQRDLRRIEGDVDPGRYIPVFQIRRQKIFSWTFGENSGLIFVNNPEFNL